MGGDAAVRVVIAEDALLTRAGIARLLSDLACDVVAEASDAGQALAATRRHRPDVVITDIRMPPGHGDEGLRLAHQIRTEMPSCAILVLSQFLEPAYALRLLEDHPGGLGYLLKDRLLDPAVLLDALRRLVDGECVIDPSIVARLMARRRTPDPLAELTERERDVLAAMAEGLTNSAIARRLDVSERTVEAHTAHIFQKFGLEASADEHRRVRSVLTYLRSSTP